MNTYNNVATNVDRLNYRCRIRKYNLEVSKVEYMPEMNKENGYWLSKIEKREQ